MRNGHNSKIERIFSLAKNLPCFSFDDLASVENNKTYLKILFSRYEKTGKVIRLKRGLYVAKEYIDNIEKTSRLSSYQEFVANILYQPSYLSLDYVLYQYNLLTDVPNNFTLITRNKTAVFVNKIGNFLYHKIKDELFCGFEIIKEGDFTILKATKAKALFDYLYLRKNILTKKKAFRELRLNLDNLDRNDLKELKKYSKIDGSKKIKEILSYF